MALESHGVACDTCIRSWDLGLQTVTPTRNQVPRSPSLTPIPKWFSTQPEKRRREPREEQCGASRCVLSEKRQQS